MLPQTPFPQMLLPRIEKARQRIAGQVWSIKKTPLQVWQTKATKNHRTFESLNDSDFKLVKQTSHYWGAMFDQCWWKVEIPLQDKAAGKQYLHWTDQGEATVYIDGVPHYGIDTGHKYAPLPHDATELVIESLCRSRSK